MIQRKSREKKLYAFDTEDDGEGNFIVNVIYDGENYYHFTDKEESYRFMYQNTGIYYAHNLSYDMGNLELFKKCVSVWRGSKVINATLWGCNTTFYDSFNISFASLAAIGKLIGNEKLIGNIDFTKEKFDINNEKHKAYVNKDAEIVYDYIKMVTKTLERYELKRPSATLASTAFKIYEKNFCMLKLAQNKMSNEYFRKFYFGGRTEAFYIGEIKNKKIHYSDVNSLYPFCMTKKIPTGAFTYSKGRKPITEFWMSYVKVTIKENCNIPPIPYRDEKKGKLIFPSGTFNAYMNSVEYKQAKKYIKNIEFIDTYEFHESEYLFKDYAEHFYSERNKYKVLDNNFMSFFTKLMLNSVYGRMAMQLEGEMSIPADFYNEFMNENEMKKKPREYEFKFTNKDNVNFINDVTKDGFNNLIWATFITAYARVELYKLIEKIEKDGGKLLYCDTDSVFYLNKKAAFKDSNALGKLECKTGSYIKIFGSKEYIFEVDGKREAFCKGVNIKDKENRFKELSRYLGGEAVEIIKPLKYKESNKRIENIPVNKWITSEKQKKTKYDKRKVLKNGFTEPLKL